MRIVVSLARIPVQFRSDLSLQPALADEIVSVTVEPSTCGPEMIVPSTSL